MSKVLNIRILTLRYGTWVDKKKFDSFGVITIKIPMELFLSLTLMIIKEFLTQNKSYTKFLMNKNCQMQLY